MTLCSGSIVILPSANGQKMNYRASEERFRQLADNIQEVFWMTDAENGREIYMSPAAELIWERSLDSLMNEPGAFINSVFPEDQPAMLDAIERERNGEKVEIEYRILRPDGSLRWIWNRGFPIFDDYRPGKKNSWHLCRYYGAQRIRNGIDQEPGPLSRAV